MQMAPWTLLLLLLAAASAARSVVASSSSTNVTFPLPDDCPSSCGDINVTYPFGLKDGCFRPGFKLFCDNSAQPPKLFLGDETTQVIDIIPSDYSLPYVWINPLSQVLNISSRDGPSWTREISWTTPGAPYALSKTNAVTLVGCDVNATMFDGGTREALGNCTSMCTDDMQGVHGSCSTDLGIGCCNFSVPRSLKSVKIRLANVRSSAEQKKNSTIVKILVAPNPFDENDGYLFKWQDLYDTQNLSGHHLRALLEWSIPDKTTCESAQENKSNYACLSDYSYCDNSTTPGLGYNCHCYLNGDGNPYIMHGCRDDKAYNGCESRICSKLLLGVIIGASIGIHFFLSLH